MNATQRLVSRVLLAITLALIVVTLFISACAPQATVESSSVSSGQMLKVYDTGLRRLDYGLYRFVDLEAGVVCWIYFEYNSRGSVSCLPISQTDLK